jgi:hypothetical protein
MSAPKGRKTMKLTSKIVSIVLIAVLTSACWASQQLPSPVQPPQRSGGCHGQTNSTPRQTPTHDCCLTGHDVAIPQLAHAERPAVQYACQVVFVNALSLAITLSDARTASIFSSESPGTTPLRV